MRPITAETHTIGEARVAIAAAVHEYTIDAPDHIVSAVADYLYELSEQLRGNDTKRGKRKQLRTELKRSTPWPARFASGALYWVSACSEWLKGDAKGK